MAIFVFTGDAPGSAVSGTRIDGNTLAGGRAVRRRHPGQPERRPARASLIDDTRVGANRVSGFAATGITAFSYAGGANQILRPGPGGQRRRRQRRWASPSPPASVAPATAGSRRRWRRNTVEQGIVAVGGSGFNCPQGIAVGAGQPARGGHRRQPGAARTCWSATGWSSSAASEGAVDNEVVALVSDNQAIGASGIADRRRDRRRAWHRQTGRPQPGRRDAARQCGRLLGRRPRRHRRRSGRRERQPGHGAGDRQRVVRRRAWPTSSATAGCRASSARRFRPIRAATTSVALRVAENEASIISPPQSRRAGQHLRRGDRAEQHAVHARRRQLRPPA